MKKITFLSRLLAEPLAPFVDPGSEASNSREPRARSAKSVFDALNSALDQFQGKSVDFFFSSSAALPARLLASSWALEA